MEIINPTPVKFSKEFKDAIVKFAHEKEMGNISAVIKKATARYIKYDLSKESKKHL